MMGMFASGGGCDHMVAHEYCTVHNVMFKLEVGKVCPVCTVEMRRCPICTVALPDDPPDTPCPNCGEARETWKR